MGITKCARRGREGVDEGTRWRDAKPGGDTLERNGARSGPGRRCRGERTRAQAAPTPWPTQATTHAHNQGPGVGLLLADWRPTCVGGKQTMAQIKLRPERAARRRKGAAESWAVAVWTRAGGRRRSWGGPRWELGQLRAKRAVVRGGGGAGGVLYKGGRWEWARVCVWGEGG